MDINSIFSGMYDDFFGIEKLTNKNFDDIKKLYEDTENLPKIEIPSQKVEEKSNETHSISNSMETPITKEKKDEQMMKFFEEECTIKC